MTYETKVKGVMNVLLDIEKQFGTDVPVSMVSILLMVPLDDSVSVQKIRQTSSLTEAGAIPWHRAGCPLAGIFDRLYPNATPRQNSLFHPLFSIPR